MLGKGSASGNETFSESLASGSGTSVSAWPQPQRLRSDPTVAGRHAGGSGTAVTRFGSMRLWQGHRQAVPQKTLVGRPASGSEALARGLASGSVHWPQPQRSLERNSSAGRPANGSEGSVGGLASGSGQPQQRATCQLVGRPASGSEVLAERLISGKVAPSTWPQPKAQPQRVGDMMKQVALPALCPLRDAPATNSVAEVFAWPQHCVAITQQEFPTVLQELRVCRPWRLSTCFSGIECAGLAAMLADAALQKTLGATCSAFVLGHACEINASCVELLQAWRPKRCVFKDVLTWSGQQRAPCFTHVDGPCEVLPADISISGPPCVDFSMFGRRARFAGKTAGHLEAWVLDRRVRKEPIVVHECVPQFPRKWLTKELGDLYMWDTVVLDSRHCAGVRRKRQYAVGFLRGHACWRSRGATLASILRPYLRRTKLTAESYFMLAHDGLQREKPSSPELKHLRGYVEAWPQAKVVDLRQNPAKRARLCMVDEPLFAMTTHSGRVWHTEHRRFLQPCEQLAAGGYPHAALPDLCLTCSGSDAFLPQMHRLSPAAQRKAAGNCMHLSCVGTLLYALRVHACLEPKPSKL